MLSRPRDLDESPEVDMEGDSGNNINDADTGRPKPRKRRRIVISCTECHRRKQKCDRKLPCTNCVSRNKEDACRYEKGAPMASKVKRETSGAGYSVRSTREDSDDSIPSKVANFGYSQTGASTLGFLKRIDGVTPGQPLSQLADGLSREGENYGIRERYKSLIRQLPARPSIDKLVAIYFREVNWQYYPLDDDVFLKQLDEWSNLPFNLLSTVGPQALSPDLRVFPALLFHVLASALLILPENDPDFDSLKYVGDMSFEDLAMEYSESGMAIQSLLGKRQMSITTVLADFIRAAFLKTVGFVTEAWHAIGVAIRDGQEVGIHRDSLDPKPKSDDVEAILENQWEIQRRRRLWMILSGWDAHTGVVLGRPTTIDNTSVQPTLPVDAPLPKDRSKTPVLPRGENEPPTPLLRAIWSAKLIMPLREILALEKEGPCPKNFCKVDKIDQELQDLEDKSPACFRRENPDKRFDHLPECYWVPLARATVPQLLSFNLMALHRPYVFTRPESRTRALQASLEMLEAQRVHFQSITENQYKIFSLFFGTFDAIVLMATIYILFPKEHPEIVEEAIQHFRWAVERFETMSHCNHLAKAALGVLQAIYIRLKKSLGITYNAKNGEGCREVACSSRPGVKIESGGSAGAAAGKSANTSPSTCTNATTILTPPTSTSTDTPVSSHSLSDSMPSQQYQQKMQQQNHQTQLNNGATGGMPCLGGPATTNNNGTDIFSILANDLVTGSSGDNILDWSVPENFDWSSIQPVYAMADLAYNDLMGTRRNGGGGVEGPVGGASPWTGGSQGWEAGPGGVGGPMGQPQQQQSPQQWQFNGDFSNDSVWSLLNQYAPF